MAKPKSKGKGGGMALRGGISELMRQAHRMQTKLEKVEPVRVDIPVICVGNLTVGGVGKTPIVEAIRTVLGAFGVRSATLSRGYGGDSKEVLKVVPGKHTAATVGDEPLMLAASGESWIGRDRVEAARAMQADGVQVIIMDDGHQNPSLYKDLSIVVIDAAVRAAPDDPLDRVDAVVRAVFRPAVRRPALLGLVREVSRLKPAQAARLSERIRPLVDRAVAYLATEMTNGRLRQGDPKLVAALAYATVTGIATEPEALRTVGWTPDQAGLRALRDELRAFLRAALAPV